MTSTLRSFALIALIASLLLTVPSDTALAASKKTRVAAETPSALTDATVNLYCRLKAGKNTWSSSGTGVFIHEKGVILTNAHVAQYFLLAAEKGRVTGWCGVRTGSPADERYTAAVLYIPPAWVAENISEFSKREPRGTGENDFALLYVTGAEKKGTLPAKFPALPLDLLTTQVLGSPVSIAGYPTESLDFDDIRNKLKRVTASSTVESIRSFAENTRDTLGLASSPAGSSGVSGGPVMDASGALAGIVTSKSAVEGDRALRAITLSYIDRTLRSQTGFPLATILAENYAVRALITAAMLPTDTVKTLSEALRKKK